MTGRLDSLRARAAQVGLRLRHNSPGDGVTRYNFESATGHDVLFALGMKEAENVLGAYCEGYYRGEEYAKAGKK